MGYVVVVFAIINSAALVVAMLALYQYREELLASVQTVMEDEVRRQDDRIEKRLAKREGPAGNDEERQAAPVDGHMVIGRPYRR